MRDETVCQNWFENKTLVSPYHDSKVKHVSSNFYLIFFNIIIQVDSPSISLKCEVVLMMLPPFSPVAVNVKSTRMDFKTKLV